MDVLLPGVPEPDRLHRLKFQAKLNCLEPSSLDDDHLFKMHAAVGKDLVPLACLTDRDVKVLMSIEKALMRKRSCNIDRIRVAELPYRLALQSLY